MESNELLKSLRKNDGLTLKQLGIKLSLSESHLSNLEKNRRKPTLSTLIKYSTFFKTSIELLIDLKN